MALYTRPALRESLKAQILAGDKGGLPGQWSARKAQMLAQQYKAQGGGYLGPKSPTQQSLERWTSEDWTTIDRGKAERYDAQGRLVMKRYLPAKAWAMLSPAERQATDQAKVQASRLGIQFVKNTPAAEQAGRLVRSGALPLSLPSPKASRKPSAAEQALRSLGYPKAQAQRLARPKGK